MKKFGLIAFICALTLGIILAGVFTSGKISVNLFSFGGGIKGSGNLQTEKRDVSDFQAVDVSGAFRVEITAQKDFAVEVEADDNLLPYIKAEVDGETLKIKTERRISPENPLVVRISAPNIESIGASGASKVTLTDLNNDLFKIDASGASSINVTGITKNLSVDISGASRFEGDDLRSENAAVEASGASRANVFASNDLKVGASGASKIYYSGNPKDLSKNISGASCVREK